MFKKTLTLSELKQSINEELGGLSGNDALQVVHRGKQIKVVITQERYFQLLGQIAQLSASSQDGELIENETSTTRKQRLRKKLEKPTDGQRKKDRALDQGRL